jgi:hypothetical protein
MVREGRMLTQDWNLYDTRHVVYRPARLKPETLKEGYDWAYREFYRWGSITRASWHHGTFKHQAKHFFYASGWKRFESLWDLIIRGRQLARVTPLLEGVLSRVTSAKGEHVSIDDQAGNARREPLSSVAVIPVCELTDTGSSVSG